MVATLHSRNIVALGAALMTAASAGQGAKVHAQLARPQVAHAP